MEPINDSEAPALALALGTTERMAWFLIQLFNRVVLTYDEIEASGISKAPGIMVVRLRRIVGPQGIAVETQHGTGYWMDNTSREAILAALRRVRSATPEGK